MTDLMVEAVNVRRQVLSCTSCPLHSSCRSPVPFRGPVPATFTVVGQAPGGQEDKEGKPFVGAAGSLFQRLLRDAGVPMGDVAWLNPVSCFPPDNREPSNAELAACAHNFRAQLSVLQPKLIILAGKVALRQFHPEAELANVHGRPMYWDWRDWDMDMRPSHLLPTYHPAAALRQNQYLDKIEQDLTYLHTKGPEDEFPTECNVCGMEAEHYDSLGVPWCGRHAARQLKLVL